MQLPLTGYATAYNVSHSAQAITRMYYPACWPEFLSSSEKRKSHQKDVIRRVASRFSIASAAHNVVVVNRVLPHKSLDLTEKRLES
jgi:hypothetical protein